MPRYLLTCNCGQTCPVDVGQAGGQLVCSCGQTLDVPTLRTLRHLPVAPTDEARPNASWNARKGIAAISLVAAALLATLGLWNWLTEPSIPKFDPVAQSSFMDRHLREMTPVDAWKSWVVVYRPLAENGFTQLELSSGPRIRGEIAQKRFLEAIFLGAAGCFLAIAVITALLPAQKN